MREAQSVEVARQPLPPAGGANHLRKYLAVAVFGVAVLFVLWNNERFFLNPAAPEWQHYNPIRWYLIPHGLGGAAALFLGASQFSTALRRKHARVHRTFGKIYIIGVFILAPVAIVMAFINSPWFLTPFTIVQSLTIMLFTGAAYLCVRRRNFVAHREWMVRSYAVLLIFLEGRVLMAIPWLARGGMDSVVLVNWACLAITLVATEFFLRWRQVFPRPSET